MSVTCGGFTKVLTVQDAHNTHTLMDPEVFNSGLIAMNKALQDYTTRELKVILLRSKRKTREVGIAGMKYQAYGPYNMLMQVDGVWIHQAVMVTLDKRFDKRLMLGSNVFESCRLKTATPPSNNNKSKDSQQVLSDLYHNVSMQVSRNQIIWIQIPE